MIDLYWQGVDGSTWDLIRGPVVVTNDGLTGLLPGPTERRTRENGRRDGQSYTGGRYLPRYVVLPVLIHTYGDAADWFSLYNAWSSSLSDSVPGKLVAVNTETGRVVTLTCCVSEWPAELTQDPSGPRAQQFVYELVADDPFWYLPTYSRTFESASQSEVNYYGGGPVDEPGTGYPLVRGAGSQAGRLQIENEGDQPAWWTATFSAPSSAFLVSIDGSTVSGAYAVPDGATLEVDSQEATISLIQAGEREALPWHLFDRVEFAPLPPGGTAEVFVRSTGSGVPTFTFWPRRREAL